MKSFGAIAISFRVAKIHWADLASQVGAAERFMVHVVDASGNEQEVQLEVTARWSGGWSRQVRCPACQEPARVLSLEGDAGVCGRCRPRRTKHHSHKNSRAWRDEGAMLDRLVRALLGRPEIKPAALSSLARHSASKALARATAVSMQASSLVGNIDASGLLDR